MNREAFFTVHRELPREGPGLPEDVTWVGQVVEIPQHGRVCDAGCGPGADLEALRNLVPDGQVDGFERVSHFVEAARQKLADDPSVRIHHADMAQLSGPYDLIWSAGAVYFLGVKPALKAWSSALRKTGAIAFSHPCVFTASPSKAAVAFWKAEPGQFGTQDATEAEIVAAGWRVLATRRLADAAWAAYYRPLLTRCDELEKAGASESVRAAIASARKEASDWRAVSGETGYVLYVVCQR